MTTAKFACAGALIYLVLAPPVMAQDPAPPTSGLIERPSERPLPSPGFEPESDQAPPLQLPPVAPPKEKGALSGLRVSVREFRFSGNTVFKADELAEIAAPYTNRVITSEELDELRQALTLHYVERGFINSGAVIPDQRVTDGVVEIRIVEGRLTDIEVEGLETLRPEFVSERIALGAGPPLNVDELQRRLRILLDSPFIERINADLRPGDQPGDARLTAQVKEGRRYDLELGLDNHVSPSLGDARGWIAGVFRNPTGAGDALTTSVAYAKGLAPDFDIEYTRPLNAWDTSLSLFFERTESEVFEEPFDDLDIESKSWSAGLGLDQPLFRTPEQLFSVGVRFERRYSKTFLLGEPFAFSPGVSSEGESDVSVLRFTGDWLRRSRSQVLAARSTFSVGTDAFGATTNSSDPDGQFLTWLGQFQWLRRIGDASGQVVFRTDVQLANDPLLPLEQFAIGGANSVRGYRENQLVRDWGYTSSLEYRIPILKNALGRTTLQLAPFVDVGAGWNRNRTTPEPRTIWSLGTGLRWDPHPKLHAQLYWGKDMEDVENPTHTIQDSGFHFLIKANIFN